MKRGMLLFVGGVVVGSAAYGLYKLMQTAEESAAEQEPIQKAKPTASPAETVQTDEPKQETYNISDLKQDKHAAESAIRERHQAASKIVRESLETIFDRSDKEAADADDEEWNQLNEELDHMMK